MDAGDPLTVGEAMRRWRPGSHEWSWRHETADLLHRDTAKMITLLDSIRRFGLMSPWGHEDPIILGDDGRVWSGHHRLVAARIINPDLPLPEGTEIYGDAP